MQYSNDNLTKTIKAALYCRVSSEEQKQGKTINSQIKELEDFAKANNYEIAGRYIDDGWSGAILERPALDRLRDEATKGLFEAVLVNDVDRLSREMLHLGIIRKDLEEKGIKLNFRNLPISGDPLSNFMINVLGSFAEFERQMIADRVRRGKKYKLEVRNIIMGNTPPYGYDYVPKTKEREGFYKINNEEAKIVRMMFDWVVKEGLTQRQVAKKLWKKKIPARKSSGWAGSSVHKVLSNSTYIGITYWNKCKSVKYEDWFSKTGYRKQGNGRRLRPREEWTPIKLPDHLKIIDENVFYRAQTQLQRNKYYARRHNTTNFYLLRGLTWCGYCDCRYSSTTCHSTSYYRCSNRLRTFPKPATCNGGLINASKLEKLVWNTVVKAIQNPDIITEQVKNFEEKQKQFPNETEQSIKDIKEKLTKLSKEEERLFEAYRREVIQLVQFKREIDKINNRRDQLNQELKGLESQKTSQASNENVLRSIEEYCQIFKDKLGQFTPEQKQTFLRLLLEKITIKDKNIEISGIIPLYDRSISTNIARNISFNSPLGNIIPTLIYRHEHNATIKFELEVKLQERNQLFKAHVHFK